jgi:hypothetical protein
LVCEAHDNCQFLRVWTRPKLARFSVLPELVGTKGYYSTPKLVARFDEVNEFA